MTSPKFSECLVDASISEESETPQGTNLLNIRVAKNESPFFV